ncbi:hypothetical protein ACHAXA_008323 [Cyclostephanos tholiformis]|uniref:PX domain-containing protein n=1 Tax=Cyclostephanos tholiformis TaxID=382380 RepID=A0ABD3R739_9STRA
MSPRHTSSPGGGDGGGVAVDDGHKQDPEIDPSIIETIATTPPSSIGGDGTSKGDVVGGRRPHLSTLPPPPLDDAANGASFVAHVAVTDPIQCTEGIKGKYTSYRIAYDPPLPSPPVPSSPSSSSSSSSTSIPSSSVPLLPQQPTTANRRYSDFTWLHDRLHKERPGAIVPPLPDKQRGSCLFDESFIEERRHQLEVFLQRALRNPELVGAECLRVFICGNDVEFRRALKDGGGGSGASGQSRDASGVDECNNNNNIHGHRATNDVGDVETNHEFPQDQYAPTASQASDGTTRGTMEKLTNKRAGIKKWIKEKKTTMQGSMVRSPDDVIFEKANHYITALEAGLLRIEAQASRMARHDKDLSSCMLEFGLGCDALAHVDDEIDGVGMVGTDVAGENDDGSSPAADRPGGIGGAFRLIGETADRASAVLSSPHDERGGGGISRFHERLRDHLKVVQAARVALSKRNNRLVTYSTCLNAVDAKRSSLHKHRISQDHQRALGVEASLGRAEAAVIAARANYDEVSARVLREIDRFRREYAMEMHATMVEFARAQKEQYDGMHEVWGSLLPRVVGLNASFTNGSSFAQEAAALREGGSRGGGAGGGEAAVHFEYTTMPTYPPPPEPVWNGGVRNGNAMESSMLNGAIRYRDALPEE